MPCNEHLVGPMCHHTFAAILNILRHCKSPKDDRSVLQQGGSGCEAVDLLASCQPDKLSVSVCEEPRQRRMKWCRVTHPWKTGAQIAEWERLNNAKGEIGDAGLCSHRRSSNGPAGSAESGGSSDWCQMLFTGYFHIKWHLRRRSSRVNTHQRDIWSNWKQRHRECSRRPRCSILGCRRCGPATQNSFFPSLSSRSATSLRSNRCFQPTLLLASH